jgi:hypothetical protein
MYPIAIPSVPRSGSTWLGEVLNSGYTSKYWYQPIFSYALNPELAGKTSRAAVPFSAWSSASRRLSEETSSASSPLPFVDHGRFSKQGELIDQVRSSGRVLMWHFLPRIRVAQECDQSLHRIVICHIQFKSIIRPGFEILSYLAINVLHNDLTPGR